MRDLGGLQKVTHYERQVLQTNAGDKNWSRFHSPADSDYVHCRKRLHHLEVVGCSKLSTIQQGAVAQLAEHRIVYPKVAGSNPVSLACGGRSSVGRAPGCGLGCRGFKSHRPPLQWG
jgi:hypothetical protein